MQDNRKIITEAHVCKTKTKALKNSKCQNDSSTKNCCLQFKFSIWSVVTLKLLVYLRQTCEMVMIGLCVVTDIKFVPLAQATLLEGHTCLYTVLSIANMICDNECGIQ